MVARHRRVVWTEGSRRELHDAIAYIAEDSRSGAIQLLEHVLAAAESLSELSERGHIVRERGDDAIRELLVDPYRLIYHVQGDTVVVLGLIHQRRDFGDSGL